MTPTKQLSALIEAEVRLSLVVANLRRMGYTWPSSAEAGPYEVLVELVCKLYIGRKQSPYPIVVVDMYRFLNLLIGRNEIKAGSLEVSLLLKDHAYWRFEIRSLVIVLATRSCTRKKIWGKRLYRAEDRDRLGVIGRQNAGK